MRKNALLTFSFFLKNENVKFLSLNLHLPFKIILNISSKCPSRNLLKRANFTKRILNKINTMGISQTYFSENDIDNVYASDRSNQLVVVQLFLGENPQ